MKNHGLKLIRTVFMVVLVLMIIIVPTRVNLVSAAGPIEVTITADEFAPVVDTGCSLREAVEAVIIMGNFAGCANPGVIDIHLPPGDYILTGASGDLLNFTGDLNIRHNMNIIGDDYINTFITGPAGDRIMRIDAGKTMTVDNVTFQYGHSPDNGGAIYNNGNLTLNYVSVHNNTAPGSGGGIYNAYQGEPQAYLGLYYSKVFYNTSSNAGGKGGGIANDSGIIEINTSEIYGNNAYSDGGGVWSVSGSSNDINHTLIHNNGSLHGSGGNIYNHGWMTIGYSRINDGQANVDGGNIYTGFPGDEGAIMNISMSEISNGSASGYGGGIANDGWLTVTNSSFNDNNNAYGANLYTSETFATTSLDHVTMSGGLTNGFIGAYDIYNAISTNPVLINNSILDASISTACRGPVSWAVDPNSSFNIDSGTTCALPGGHSNQSNTDPKLGAFDFHGGNTMTSPLAFTSPAVDTANAIGCPLTDQRGVVRPIDGNRDGINGCDIGAYELEMMDFFPLIVK